MNREHGSPFDRGSADSWYRRGRNPHWYPEGTGFGKRIEIEEMTELEIGEYLAGFEDNESDGTHKEWE